jgi:hypothetical protein
MSRRQRKNGRLDARPPFGHRFPSLFFLFSSIFPSLSATWRRVAASRHGSMGASRVLLSQLRKHTGPHERVQLAYWRQAKQFAVSPEFRYRLLHQFVLEECAPSSLYTATHVSRDANLNTLPLCLFVCLFIEDNLSLSRCATAQPQCFDDHKSNIYKALEELRQAYLDVKQGVFARGVRVSWASDLLFPCADTASARGIMFRAYYHFICQYVNEKQSRPDEPLRQQVRPPSLPSPLLSFLSQPTF